MTSTAEYNEDDSQDEDDTAADTRHYDDCLQRQHFISELHH